MVVMVAAIVSQSVAPPTLPRLPGTDFFLVRPDSVLAMMPARIVTLKPDGAIRWAVPVALNAGIRDASADVCRLRRMAMSRAASGWGSNWAIALASRTRRW